MAKGISVNGLTKSFGLTRVLREVTLAVEAGEFVSLVGPSGCGKSTLLRVIAGLEDKDSGSIAIGGLGIDSFKPSERDIAMVFQNYALYPHMTVRENVSMPLVMGRMGGLQRQPFLGALIPGRRAIARDIEQEVVALCKSLQLDGLLDRKPGQLSGGQRQRVALARAMVRQPAAFLMDEPLSNLDAKLRLQIREELASLHKRLGVTFLYVTHDQAEALTLSDRVAVMDSGRILQFDAPQVLYSAPATLQVARFIGSPAINELPITFDSRGQFVLGERVLNLSIDCGDAPEELCFAIRAENIWFANERGPCEFSITANARVLRAEHHGAEWIYFLELQDVVGSVVTCRAPVAHHRTAIVVGTQVEIGFNLSNISLFSKCGSRMDARLTLVRPRMLKNA
jgi:multiple sugar transport system ATP-binding protein